MSDVDTAKEGPNAGGPAQAELPGVAPSQEPREAEEIQAEGVAPFTKTENFDCGECPGFCCTYKITEVGPTDQKRLARGLGITEREVEERYCRWENNAKLVLRQTPDPVLGVLSCIFLDKETRGCKVHGIRPRVCKSFPHEERCKWWDRWTEDYGRRVFIMEKMPGTLA